MATLAWVLTTYKQLMFHRDCSSMIGFCFVLLPRIQGDSFEANLARCDIIGPSNRKEPFALTYGLSRHYVGGVSPSRHFFHRALVEAIRAASVCSGDDSPFLRFLPYPGMTLNPFRSRKARAWRATMASSISVVVLLIIAMTRRLLPEAPVSRFPSTTLPSAGLVRREYRGQVPSRQRQARSCVFRRWGRCQQKRKAHGGQRCGLG